MKEQFVRTEMILGEKGMEQLFHSSVAVFGLGGVGGHVMEALARSGIGTLYLCDNDTVSESNLNRQIIATYDSVGKYKTDVARERILSINKDANVIMNRSFVLPENADAIDFTKFDYIVDAIDTVAGKLTLIEHAKAAGVPIISCMGTGNKMNAGMLEIADIYETSVCPLCRVMRKELKARGIENCKVLYSKEEPIHPKVEVCQEGRRSVPGSNAFVPAVAGLMIAGEVVRELAKVQ